VSPEEERLAIEVDDEPDNAGSETSDGGAEGEGLRLGGDGGDWPWWGGWWLSRWVEESAADRVSIPASTSVLVVGTGTSSSTSPIDARSTTPLSAPGPFGATSTSRGDDDDIEEVGRGVNNSASEWGRVGETTTGTGSALLVLVLLLWKVFSGSVRLSSRRLDEGVGSVWFAVGPVVSEPGFASLRCRCVSLSVDTTAVEDVIDGGTYGMSSEEEEGEWYMKVMDTMRSGMREGDWVRYSERDRMQ
jgi:hypothetical protein